MSTPHLPIERLAELVDGSPTLFEREHLGACARCNGELESYGRLVALAADERRRIGPPLTSWDAIRERLDAEGLVAPPVRRPAGRMRTWLPRAAAAAALLTGGTVAGRLSAGMPLDRAFAFGGAGRAAGAMADMRIVPVGGGSAAAANALRSPEDALAQLQQAQSMYDEAATWLASHDTTTSTLASDQYRTRLAALDMASETFEQALSEAPGDPVLNQYLRATMNAREVAIRRLGTTLPATMRVGRF